MNAAGDRLEPYLPSLVLDWLSETPDARHQAVAGSVVFVDISGFTKLSERLARLGKVGAELLAETIGACFSELLTVAYAEGGGLLKFGGDALLLLFDGEGHEGRACRAAIGMRRTLRRIGRLDVSGQSVSLRMSVGVHTGVFHLFLVGRSHRELVVAGPAATTVVEMESTAGAGEILVSPTTAAAIRANYVGAAKGPGFLLLRAPDTRIEPRPASAAAALGVDISVCISVAVRESLVAGSVEPEHRRVTVAFVHFDGTDELIESRSAEDATREIDDMITDVQRAVDRQGIAFLGTDVDHDGGKVILTAGAPKSSGDDERRMLLALREIMERERAISLRIGVNRGDAFVGDIGPRYRRTFTVMGDAVNLAARVMARAGPGEILATESVIEGSPTAFETSALEPFLVKGKAKPVTAFAVGAPVGAKVSSTTVGSPLIGRKVEVDVMTRAMRAAIAGEGALVELVGEPGLGKSRLVEELQRRASAMTQIAAACEPYESSTPYFPFRVLLREQLGIPAALPADEARQRLETVFAALAPEYHAWAPLVARVVDVDMPDTPEIAQLDERFRRARLGEVMRGVLAHVMSTPTLVLFEDAHWMDEASADLLGDLATTVGFLPCLICVTRRDTDSGFTPREGTATTLRLEPLGPADAAELLRVATERSPIPAHELAALAERSGGNPLFLQELVATVRDSDSMDALPDTIEALITARIDRLPPNDRMVLRRASVLGRSFPRDLLPAVFDVVPPRGDDVWTRLSGFLSNDDSGTVAFEHALVRDCAYEGLSYRVRRRLHAQVADLIRESAGDEPDTAAARLSVHYLHAQRFAEAWDYSLVAAAQAKAVYANVEAAEHYERAIQASRSLPDLGVDEMVGVHESLGDVLDRVGTFAAAQRAYRAARRLVRDDPVAEAGLLMKLAWVQGWLDRYSQALRWITRGIKTLEGVEGREAARRRAQLLAWYGHFCQEGGRHARAIKWCTLAVTEAEAVGADDALAHALRVLDWAYMDLGRLDEAVNLTRALTLYEKLGDLTGQSNVLNMLGGFAYWRGEWSDALDLYARAREIGQRTGDTVMPAFCASNIGEIALDQGRLDDARELFVEALHVWRGTGRRSGVAFAKCNLGRVAASQGDYAEAERLFEESRAESLAVGAHAEVLETDARLAECYAMAGDFERALELVEHTLEQARALGGVRAQSPLLWRIQAMCWLRLGDLDAARPAIEQSLSDARARQADYEVALSLLLQADLVERGGVGPPAEELRAESDGILERLGAVAARGFVSV